MCTDTCRSVRLTDTCRSVPLFVFFFTDIPFGFLFGQPMYHRPTSSFQLKQFYLSPILPPSLPPGIYWFLWNSLTTQLCCWQQSVFILLGILARVPTEQVTALKLVATRLQQPDVIRELERAHSSCLTQPQPSFNEEEKTWMRLLPLFNKREAGMNCSCPSRSCHTSTRSRKDHTDTLSARGKRVRGEANICVPPGLIRISAKQAGELFGSAHFRGRPIDFQRKNKSQRGEKLTEVRSGPRPDSAV